MYFDSFVNNISVSCFVNGLNIKKEKSRAINGLKMNYSIELEWLGLESGLDGLILKCTT